MYISEILNVDRRGLGAAMYSVLHSFGFFLVLFTGDLLKLFALIYWSVINDKKH